MTTAPIHIHRHRNGMIDFDYYRERANALRRAAHHDTAALKLLVAGVLLSSCLLVALLAHAVTRPTTVVETIPPSRTIAVR